MNESINPDQPETLPNVEDAWSDSLGDMAVPVIEKYLDSTDIDKSHEFEQELLKRLSTNIEIGLSQLDKKWYDKTKSNRTKAFGPPEKVELT